MTPEQEAQRGQDAKRLLDDPLLKEAFDAIEQEFVDQWKKAPVRDVEGREKLWLMLQLLNKVHSHLEAVMASGRLAEATLAQRLKRRLGRRTSE
jgi:hypothetical protein